VIEDGWEPIKVRVEDDADVHPSGPRRKKVRHLALAQEPIIGPGLAPAEEADLALPRLARHEITLEDGHTVGVAVCGRGVPLVIVHGFSAEGILYAQTLSRLVDLGFKVIAVDTAGHGGTLGLPTGAQSMGSYAALLGRVLDHLGVGPAVLAGHSMGGRLVTELAASEPHRAIAVILLDAIVGDTWDRMVNVFRVFPPLLVGTGATLLVDTVTTVPWFRDPRQAAKLARLAAPTMFGHIAAPWRLLGPGISILRSSKSRAVLEVLAAEHVPTFVLHGDRDMTVPLATARSAAARSHGRLVTDNGATHSWLLKDPETLPAIVSELLEEDLGAAIRNAITSAGAGSVDQLEDIFYTPDAPILALSPPLDYERLDDTHRRPRYTWTIQ
jgi:pimeloyl-ACP methyl ester carboxylesterase